MADNTGYSAESLLVIGVIVTAFIGFLLFFFIPAHELILPIILGVAVLIFVVFSMCYCPGVLTSGEQDTTTEAGTKHACEQVPENLPDTQKPKKKRSF